MNYSAIALDLDGTLTNHQKQITPRTRKTLELTLKQGLVVILASGRPVLGINSLADILQLSRYKGYLLAYNGGQIIDCRLNQPIFTRLLPITISSTICDLARRYHLSALTYDDSGILAEDAKAKYVQREAYNNAISIQTVPDLARAVTKPVTKFMLVGEPANISYALPFVKQTLGYDADVFLSEPYFMEIVPPGIEKAAALKYLLRTLQIPQEQLIAIGDGLNDKTMLEFAGFSIAMGNACEEIKNLADFVTASNEEDGVALALETFVLSSNLHN